MRALTDPHHVISMPDAIRCYELCSNEFAYNLLAVALKHRLCLILVGLPVSAWRAELVKQIKQLMLCNKQEESGEFGYRHLQEIELDDNEQRCVNALAFTPDTSLNCTPNNVTLAAARGDHLDIFRTDLGQFNTVQKLRGHTDYINDVSWVCEGELLASVSDDFTCRFWTTSDEQNVITLRLTSAGMSIKSHPDDPNKVLVAEKRGLPAIPALILETYNNAISSLQV